MGELIIPVKITSEKLTPEQQLENKMNEIHSFVQEYSDTIDVLDNMYREHYESLKGIMKEPDDDILHALTVARVCVTNVQRKKFNMLLGNMNELIAQVKEV